MERPARESAGVSGPAENEATLVQYDDAGERMNRPDIDRLLRSAARAPQPDAEVPFGFDTRVVSASRSGGGVGNDLADFSRFLRGAGALACAVVVIGGAATYRQYREEARFASLATNEYAIVDSAIETELLR